LKARGGECLKSLQGDEGTGIKNTHKVAKATKEKNEII
jgi:hypothetical protein